MERFTEFFLRMIESADPLTIFLYMILDEAGPGLVLPGGDIVKVLAGYRVSQGRADLIGTLLLFEAAALVGASILYWVSAQGGRPLLYRWGPVFRFSEARIERLEDLIGRRGVLAILLGRMIPGPRIPLVVMAGVLGMPYLKFLPAMAVGSLVYNLLWVLLGMWAGPQATSMLGRIELPLRVVVSSALFVGLSWIMLSTYRRAARARAIGRGRPLAWARRHETAALAGCLATFEMLLGVNVLLYALSALGVTWPEAALMQLVERGAPIFTEGSVPRYFMHLTFVLIVGNLICALVYAHLAEPVLPGPAWLRGLLFVPLPLIVSQLALMPWLGAGPFGLDLGAGWLPAVGEVFRNALFGVSLGVSYALLRAAREEPLPSEMPPAADAPAGAGS